MKAERRQYDAVLFLIDEPSNSLKSETHSVCSSNDFVLFFLSFHQEMCMYRTMDTDLGLKILRTTHWLCEPLFYWIRVTPSLVLGRFVLDYFMRCWHEFSCSVGFSCLKSRGFSCSRILTMGQKQTRMFQSFLT